MSTLPLPPDPDGKNAVAKGNIVPATLRQKIVLASILVVVTAIVVGSIFELFAWIESSSIRIVEVSWPNDNNLTVKPGPGAFFYDRKAKLIRYRGLVTDDTKKTLSGLVEGNDPSYQEAIDELAFNSYQTSQSAFRWILLLAGTGGIAGVQIRSLFDFIGNDCYKRELDVYNWWPWYALRLPLGFLLGMLIVILIRSEVLATARQGEATSFWWLSLAAIAGFGVSDVIARLRLLSKTLFGAEKRS